VAERLMASLGLNSMELVMFLCEKTEHDKLNGAD
jgi:hypothetical protein